MKNVIYLFVLCSAFLTGCKQEFPFYSEETMPYLNFVYAKDQFNQVTDSVVNYSFVYSDETVVRDTLWLEVKHIGHIPTTDLHFSIKQVVETEGGQAVPGVHYVSFDDPGIAAWCVMPAGKITTKVPLVLLRDASLQTQEIRLRLTIADGGDYLAGVDGQLQRLFVVSDQLVRPAAWERYIEAFVLGSYSKKKHEFLIRTIENERVDDEYFEKLLAAEDYTYWGYVNKWLKIKLAEYNADPNNTDTPLRDENGNVVDFNTML